IAACIGAGVLGYYAISAKAYYEADLTFVVKSKNSGGGGLDNILGQLGWGANGGNANLTKVKSVAFSKSVLKDALYDSAYINNHRDLLANHVAEIYGFKEQWTESNKLLKFSKFEVDQQYNDSNVTQNVAFNSVLNLVRGSMRNDGVLAIETNEATDMMSFKLRSLNEELSYNLSNSIFNSLNEFYLHDEVSNTQNTIASLRKETDSVGRLLKSKEYQLANAQDRNYGIILRKNQVNQEEIRRDINVLTGVYAQMRQNLELRQFGLMTNSSIFDVLEHPVLPLSKKRKSIPVYAMVGFGLGLVTALLFLVVRRFLLDELK
ncbi:MAG: hypothetical protein HKP14_09030, partial [Bacteroidia bacterium]|nr:hypothetical protein [Bacteroidia bacterium]